jgi:hypothetical protein
MNTQATTSQHLILFRGTNWHQGLSPETVQQTMGRWNDWLEGLIKDGKLLAGHPLANEGKLITGKNATVSDGPFTESKEAIGGFLMVNVSHFDEAVKIAQACPALPYGIQVEVRPVVPICPAAQAAQMHCAEPVAMMA